MFYNEYSWYSLSRLRIEKTVFVMYILYKIKNTS
jgi:hypothetical protein